MSITAETPCKQSVSATPSIDILSREYHQAGSSQNGHLLAATISPIAPARYLNRLEAIYHSTNAASVSKDVSYALTKNANRAISLDDRQVLETWSDIYVAYWHVVGALLAAEDEGTNADWAKVYESWKDMVNTVIKGYSNSMLENWTLPVLYLCGKYLRAFAIKADNMKKSAEGGNHVDMGGLQDDIAGDFGKNEKLEDAARVLNRMFTLCISDRYVASSMNVITMIALLLLTFIFWRYYSIISSPSASYNLIRLTSYPELRSKTPANGVYTPSPTRSSKPTSA